jgi:preprotein translocase subunit SecA
MRERITPTKEGIMATNKFADKLVKKIFGSSSSIFLKKVKTTIDEINEWEPKLQAMSDDELKAQTPKFKEMISRHLDGITDKA